MDKRIVIIGGGPCGLGAAIRLEQLGHKNWTLLERENYVGGLATSFDSDGFQYDIGAHVIFSHYNYFNDVTNKGVEEYFRVNKKNLPSEHVSHASADGELWHTHKRKCFIRLNDDHWVAYPFQNNFFRNQKDDESSRMISECLTGLSDLNSQQTQTSVNRTFQDFVNNQFGSGIAKHFMNPYNTKIWGYPLDQMNSKWIGERVAKIELNKIVNDYVNHVAESKKTAAAGAAAVKEVDNWGPNATFRYPKFDGTGSIWKGVGLVANKNKSNIKLNSTIVEIDAKQKLVKLANDTTLQYDVLVSTMPIDILVDMLRGQIDFKKGEKELNAPKYSTTHIVGLGFDGDIPDDLRDKSWLYFPSLTRSKFYRATLLSNFSPFLVKEPFKNWSVVFEIAETSYRSLTKEEEENLVDIVVQGALNENLIEEKHVGRIVNKFYKKLDHGYPTPYLERDEYLEHVEPLLRANGIYSRGRFGGWKYEVSNQDHSLMQGVECADNILFGCEEQTLFYPNHVNTRKETTRRFI